MPVSVLLNEAASVILNSQGNGTAHLGPLTAYESWQPSTGAVSVATNSNEAQCAIYMGDQPVQQNLVGTTLSGSTGDSTGLGGLVPMQTGQYIWAVWTGGDPGSLATIKVQGSKNLVAHND